MLFIDKFQIQLVDLKHEWKYQNAWFVYQYDMPMIIRRRKVPSQ